MYDKEHREYLRRLRFNKFLVHLFQFLLILIFLYLWEYMSDNKIINSFIYSSPSRAIDSIYNLYLKGDLFYVGYDIRNFNCNYFMV